MKQTQIPPTPPQDKETDNNNRSLSSLWNLWVDNLKAVSYTHLTLPTILLV